ncbi:hypothetical protein H5410_031498 [Solanum commersonii]|uniref:Uncharacterized protein n=1 Tax=Solanum commersonii TaxID=4109 RepID=A0A9J5YKC9_SOLCO|nr:hypothetical protein H5410_031498 [Solanum commersonii]
MLSFGGKEVLLPSVLQSIPIYVLSAITPPKYVIKDSHRIFAKKKLECCSIPMDETIEHLILKGEVVVRTWDHYFRVADLVGPMLHLK